MEVLIPVRATRRAVLSWHIGKEDASINSEYVLREWTDSFPLSPRHLWTLTLILLCLLAGQGLAGTPGKINYQGILTDTDVGDPIEGMYTLTFRIFNQADDGVELWSESQEVEVGPAGVFSVILGSINPIGLSFSAPYWLEVEIGGEILSPRRELVSVPYAFRSRKSGDSDSLGGIHSADYVVQGETEVVTSDMISGGSGSGLDADMLDGLDSEAFADSGHGHDDRYYRQDVLNTPGNINDGANPVDWTKLKGVPGGFADGADDVGPGDGHSLDAADGSPEDALYVDGEARVGIGTTNPTNGRLEVATPTGVGIYSTSSDNAGVVGSMGTLSVPYTDAGVVAIGEEASGLLVLSGGALSAARIHNLGGGSAVETIGNSISASMVVTQFGNGPGITASSNGGHGVSGKTNSLDAIGVTGLGAGYYAELFPDGFYRPAGLFAGRNGVAGYTREINGIAVLGVAEATGAWAGSFHSSSNGVSIIAGLGKTGLSVSGGSKSAVVETDSGKRQLYCEESSEVWFTDYGFGQLVEGTATVPIDPVFAQTVNLDEPYHVFIQVYGDAEIYVAERTASTFEVSLRDGDPGAEFSYRLVAKRKGFEDDRLAVFPGIATLQQTDSGNR